MVNQNSAIVKGRLVHLPFNTVEQKERKKRLQKISKMNSSNYNRKTFDFKIFTSVRDILDYLGLLSYLHIFSDNRISHTADFYLLDEFKLKKLLVPVQVRKLILRYIVFYNKQANKRHKKNYQNSSLSRVDTTTLIRQTHERIAKSPKTAVFSPESTMNDCVDIRDPRSKFPKN